MSDVRKVFARVSLCTGCRACEIACAVEHSASKTLYGALFEAPLPRSSMNVQFYDGVKLPLNCRHCAEPACLFACKAGAISKDQSTGEVQVNLNQCVGCWMCVMVCPFGAIWSDPERYKSVKCDLCRGRSAGPACVQSCPTKALVCGTWSNVENW